MSTCNWGEGWVEEKEQNWEREKSRQQTRRQQYDPEVADLTPMQTPTSVDLFMCMYHHLSLELERRHNGLQSPSKCYVRLPADKVLDMTDPTVLILQ